MKARCPFLTLLSRNNANLVLTVDDFSDLNDFNDNFRATMPRHSVQMSDYRLRTPDYRPRPPCLPTFLIVKSSVRPRCTLSEWCVRGPNDRYLNKSCYPVKYSLFVPSVPFSWQRIPFRVEIEFRRQETVARIIPKQKRIYNREMSELFSF